jgi:hypothetical protein
VAHNDHVAVILQHFYGILDGFLVPVARAGHLGIRETGHVPAQAVHGGFVSQTGAGGRLVESRHHGLFGQNIGVATLARDRLQFTGDFENAEKF